MSETVSERLCSVCCRLLPLDQESKVCPECDKPSVSIANIITAATKEDWHSVREQGVGPYHDWLTDRVLDFLPFAYRNLGIFIGRYLASGGTVGSIARMKSYVNLHTDAYSPLSGIRFWTQRIELLRLFLEDPHAIRWDDQPNPPGTDLSTWLDEQI